MSRGNDNDKALFAGLVRDLPDGRSADGCRVDLLCRGRGPAQEAGSSAVSRDGTFRIRTAQDVDNLLDKQLFVRIQRDGNVIYTGSLDDAEQLGIIQTSKAATSGQKRRGGDDSAKRGCRECGDGVKPTMDRRPQRSMKDVANAAMMAMRNLPETKSLVDSLPPDFATSVAAAVSDALSSATLMSADAAVDIESAIANQRSVRKNGKGSRHRRDLITHIRKREEDAKASANEELGLADPIAGAVDGTATMSISAALPTLEDPAKVKGTPFEIEALWQYIAMNLEFLGRHPAPGPNKETIDQLRPLIEQSWRQMKLAFQLKP